MTQNEKDLLLKDLCARLPYKVKVQDTYYKSLEPNPIWLIDLHAQKVRLFADEGYQSIEYIKPYLFPISSMTPEQKEEFDKMAELDVEYIITLIKNDVRNWTSGLNRLNWLLKNHFDVYDLIPMGLANDATNKNIY